MMEFEKLKTAANNFIWRHKVPLSLLLMGYAVFDLISRQDLGAVWRQGTVHLWLFKVGMVALAINVLVVVIAALFRLQRGQRISFEGALVGLTLTILFGAAIASQSHRFATQPHQAICLLILSLFHSWFGLRLVPRYLERATH